MAIALNTLVAECDRFLDAARIVDYCPNGLQVEGRAEVRRIVSGVTASQALLDAAVEAQADLVLVHHGYFWKNENPCVTGIKQRRLKTLLSHDISLLAYHLPLDLHAEVGNNVQLARRLKRQRGLDCPRDISLVGFDDIRFAQYLHPQLTTVRQPKEQIGHEVVRLLLDILAGRSTALQNITLPHQLVVRNSTAAPLG